jgi:hypothetical protein
VLCFSFAVSFLCCSSQEVIKSQRYAFLFFVAAAQQRYILLPLWRVYFF